MGDVSIRELRHHGGDVVNRVAAGEVVTVTRDGRPVAELRPLRQPLTAHALLERWRSVPHVDVQRLRSDIDLVLDAHL